MLSLVAQQSGGGGMWSRQCGNSPLQPKRWHLREEVVHVLFIFGNQNMYILFS